MKKDKQIVMTIFNKSDKSKLHFVATDFYDDIDDDEYEIEKLNDEIKHLKMVEGVEERILEILNISNDYSTFDSNNKFQCRSDANRSCIDIWRIYINYFRPISIFRVMRALYNLCVVNEDVGTLYCHDIEKQVFFTSDNCMDDVFQLNEMGVRFAEWRTIGL